MKGKNAHESYLDLWEQIEIFFRADAKEHRFECSCIQANEAKFFSFLKL